MKVSGKLINPTAREEKSIPKVHFIEVNLFPVRLMETEQWLGKTVDNMKDSIIKEKNKEK